MKPFLQSSHQNYYPPTHLYSHGIFSCTTTIPYVPILHKLIDCNKCSDINYCLTSIKIFNWDTRVTEKCFILRKTTSSKTLLHHVAMKLSDCWYIKAVCWSLIYIFQWFLKTFIHFSIFWMMKKTLFICASSVIFFITLGPIVSKCW